MLDLANKKVCVIGYGKSGRAAAEKLLDMGAKVKISDSKEIQDKIIGQNIEYETAGHSVDFCCNSDLIIVSPGVHLDISPIEEAKKRNIPVISEIELAFNFLSKPIIAITGTNGKTTTTTLIGEILKNAGLRVAVAGNIGTPLISVDDSNLDYVVAEISSYQLETIENFRPHIAVLLNITPDHLERYKNMENYLLAKKRIFENQTSDDYCVYNFDDGLVVKATEGVFSKKVPFSLKNALQDGFFVNGEYAVRLSENVTEPVFKLDDLKIKGWHNVENALAASAVSYLCGVSRNDIAKTLRQFNGVEHRIEYVRTINGVDFYNDSKATNPDSTIVALKAISRGKNIILILGGRDKGTDLDLMVEEIKKCVKHVFLVGEAAQRFENALRDKGFLEITKIDSLSGAVEASLNYASFGDTVLLSPACASFDMFNDFEHRGRVFKDIVNSL